MVRLMNKAEKEFFLLLEVVKWILMRFSSMHFWEKSEFPSVLEEERCLLYQVYATIVTSFLNNTLEAPSLSWPYEFGWNFSCALQERIYFCVCRRSAGSLLNQMTACTVIHEEMCPTGTGCQGQEEELGASDRCTGNTHKWIQWKHCWVRLPGRQLSP